MSLTITAAEALAALSTSGTARRWSTMPAVAEPVCDLLASVDQLVDTERDRAVRGALAKVARALRCASPEATVQLLDRLACGGTVATTLEALEEVADRARAEQ